MLCIIFDFFGLPGYTSVTGCLKIPTVGWNWTASADAIPSGTFKTDCEIIFKKKKKNLELVNGEILVFRRRQKCNLQLNWSRTDNYSDTIVGWYVSLLMCGRHYFLKFNWPSLRESIKTVVSHNQSHVVFSR